MRNEQVTAGVGRLRLDPYCPHVPRLMTITDTNALFSSIVHDYRHGRPSRLRQMTVGETSILYAPDHVYDEVYEHLANISRVSGVPVAELRKVFEEHYLSILRFVTVAAEDVNDPQVLAISDPDDMPTGQLAKLISPCVVFSKDKHLRKPGFAPENWLDAAGYAVGLADGVVTQNVASNLMLSPGWAAVELIKFVSRRLGVSPWLVGGIAALAAGVVLADPGRRAKVGRAFEQYGVPILQGLMEMMSEGQLQQALGIEGLREVLLPAPLEPSVKQQVAIILARQTEPLLAREIQEQIESYFSSELVPTVSEVRSVLRSNPEFVVYQRSRWAFGGYLAPLPGGI